MRGNVNCNNIVHTLLSCMHVLFIENLLSLSEFEEPPCIKVKVLLCSVMGLLLISLSRYSSLPSIKFGSGNNPPLPPQKFLEI